MSKTNAIKRCSMIKINHYEKKGCLLDKLQELQELQLTSYTMLCRNNSFSTTMQLPYDYNHNVMLMSFFIHPSKFNKWCYEVFSWFFWNIDIHCPLWLFILDGLGLWHVAQSNVAMWHINWILETNIYIYIYVCMYVCMYICT
jgi:hypothetical protein